MAEPSIFERALGVESQCGRVDVYKLQSMMEVAVDPTTQDVMLRATSRNPECTIFTCKVVKEGELLRAPPGPGQELVEGQLFQAKTSSEQFFTFCQTIEGDVTFLNDTQVTTIDRRRFNIHYYQQVNRDNNRDRNGAYIVPPSVWRAQQTQKNKRPAAAVADVQLEQQTAPGEYLQRPPVRRPRGRGAKTARMMLQSSASMEAPQPEDDNILGLLSPTSRHHLLEFIRCLVSESSNASQPQA